VGGYAPRARKTMCARGACDALLGGPSTSPVGATMALRLAMCFVFWAASASWAQTDASVPSHATWQRIEVGPVSFFAPSEVRAISPLFAPKEDPASTPSTVTAADNYARAFDGPTLSFVVQSGPALKDIDAGVEDAGSPSFPSFRAHYEGIGGMRARMESYTAPKNGVLRWENWRVVYFADTGKPNIRVLVTASCDGATGCREIEEFFRTIRFK
jgi:hypothetical protein